MVLIRKGRREGERAGVHLRTGPSSMGLSPAACGGDRGAQKWGGCLVAFSSLLSIVSGTPSARTNVLAQVFSKISLLEPINHQEGWTTPSHL